MTTQKNIYTKLTKLETENKYQTSAINELKDIMKQHVESSEVFRIQCSKNASNISWLKRGILSIFGIIGGIIVWLVSTLLSG